ncbi:type II toxin-antitoxin system ParD family antitoxin [soil metagenome]
MGGSAINVNLTPRLEEIIHNKVKSGLYNNASEVVREAIRQMDDGDRLKRLRVAIAEGDADIARGNVLRWTDETMDELKREADQADALGLPIDDDLAP